MKLREEIENYCPVNEKEKKDQELILKTIDSFDDVLTRENNIIHFTCSGFILNETRDKVLMIHHNIYNSWGWTGGHADGESNFLEVALKEAEEETGVKNVKPISKEIVSLDVIHVIGHVKSGKYVSPHLHASVAYLLEANENETIQIKEDENSNIGWHSLDTYLDLVTEEHMKPIYTKIVEKAKELE